MKQQFLKTAIALSLIISSATINSNAQSPNIKWQKAMGGSNDDSNGFSKIIELHDGNYLIVGWTASTDGNFTSFVNKGGSDAFAIKFKPNGQIIWIKSFGGSLDDGFDCAIEKPDHTLIVAGNTYSNDGDVSGNHGDADAWVVKLSANGNLLSQHCYGGLGEDRAIELTRVGSNKYAFSGWSLSTDGDISTNHGDNDAWVVMLDNNASMIWSKTFGGSSGEIAVSIFSPQPNKMIISGFTSSSDGQMNNYHGGDFDAYAMAISSTGNLIWSKCYGGSDADYSGFHSGAANDGNLLISGSTYSNDGDVTGNHGGSDSWVLKVNNMNGNVIWSKCSGTSQYDFGYGILTKPNGDLVALGFTGPDDELFGSSNSDAFVVGLDKNGNQHWTKTFGGNDYDEVEDGVSLPGGDMLLLGNTSSGSSAAANFHGGIDLWLVRLDGNNCNHHRDGITDENNLALRIMINPVSTSTTISFSLPESQNISLQIFDVNGRLAGTLANSKYTEGEHQIEFNVEKLNAGIYFLKMQAGEFLKTEKVVVTK